MNGQGAATPAIVVEYRELWERACREGESTTIEVLDFEILAAKASKEGIEIADADERGVRWRSHRQEEKRAWQLYRGERKAP